MKREDLKIGGYYVGTWYDGNYSGYVIVKMNHSSLDNPNPYLSKPMSSFGIGVCLTGDGISFK